MDSAKEAVVKACDAEHTAVWLEMCVEHLKWLEDTSNEMVVDLQERLSKKKESVSATAKEQHQSGALEQQRRDALNRNVIQRAKLLRRGPEAGRGRDRGNHECIDCGSEPFSSRH